jgi:Mg2+-importing ATPase
MNAPDRTRAALFAVDNPRRRGAAHTGIPSADPRRAATLIALAAADIADVLRQLEASDRGLSSEEAARRLAAAGPNVAVRERRHSLLRELAVRFANPLNALLLILATVSWLLGDRRAAIVIAVMVVLSVSLAFVQEHRSSLAAAKLRALVRTHATVRRRGGAAAGGVEVPIEQLVPGDIVQLSAGDMIPADLRLLTARDLFVNQSTLTGEAMPVEKFAEPFVDGGAAVPELRNICFMGSNVVSGAATAVVVATGARTLFGEVAERIAGVRAPTAFDRGIDRFTGLMIRFIGVMVPLVFVVNGLTKGDWLQALLFAVAVAVGLTPEMLPMIVTVNLAKGALAMSRKRVIVKRLNSIQDFGAMDVLCTDKTGTLTQDRIILKHHYDLRGEESARVLEYAYLNSRYQSGLKNLLDIAVLEHTELEAHLSPGARYNLVDEMPFDFTRRRLSVVLAREDGSHVLICKGAVEEIFAVCTHYELDGRTAPLDAGHFADAQAESARLNADGFRVVALAYREFAAPQANYTIADESGLTLLGWVAFLDPPKESAGEAIAALCRAGIGVKIVTGDNDIVTAKVCRDVGVEAGRIVLGREIEGLDDAALAVLAEGTTVFAKVSPAQKARIVDALHRKGHVVGFLGDGINDGPALHAADIGISVDTAVDIAKESADIILLEKSLAVLGDGVLEGRRVFGNITKYIKMGASSNFGNMFSMLGASVFLPFLPMAPIQVLTNNLLYDFSQAAIPTDSVDAEYLQRPRRWDIGNIRRFMLFVGPISSIFDYVTFALLLFAFHAWSRPALFQTGWFVESLLTQTLIIHIIRTAKVPFLQSRASNGLIATTLAVCLVGTLLPYSWLGAALGFVPLPAAYWPCVATILFGYAALAHAVKVWFTRRWGY